MTIIPVILSGGSGTRLWPMSIAEKPKQFLPLVGKETMIQQTLLRLEGLETADPIVICNQAHRFVVAQQMQQIGMNAVIMLEPLARNTAPAIACGAFKALETDKDAVMVVLPSDHVIKNKGAFCKAVKAAAEEAMKGSLVTFGIVPTMPHTGYGYVKAGKSNDNIVFDLEKFVEKPDAETAKKYLAEGTYSWNSGMFVFKAQTFIDELKSFEPEMAELSFKAFEASEKDSDFIRINKDYFEQIKGNSIDYAVMEKTKKGKIIKLNAGWDDVGSYSALFEINEKDSDGNVIYSSEKTASIDSKSNYINTKKKTALIGVENLVVVETDDALLVCSMDKCQDVKKAAELLSK
jgi:mannose-1-phosphate guanylyltransferase/mannose-1-phosphate guanylyltransferase/mannose-6-phosphate isomerase